MPTTGEVIRTREKFTHFRESMFLKQFNKSQKYQVINCRIEEISDENYRLKEEICLLRREMDKKPRNRVLCLEKAMDKLETSVVNERTSHHNLVEKLRKEKVSLVKELDKLRVSEKLLKQKLRSFQSPSRFVCQLHNKIIIFL